MPLTLPPRIEDERPPAAAAAAETNGGEDTELDEAPPQLGRRFFNLRTLASFAAGFGLLLFMLTRVQVDVGGILERVGQANPGLLLLALLAYYATFPVRALRWRTMLRTAGFPGGRAVHLPSLRGLSEIILLSWFANCVVPAKLGDAYRAYLLKHDTGASFSRTVGTILAERVMDFLILFGLMAAAASFSFGRALPSEIVLLIQVGFALAVAVVVGLALMKNLRPIAERLLPRRLHSKYHRFEQGTLRSFRQLPLVLLLSGLAWGAEVARLYLVTLALGADAVFPSVILFVALASALATTLPLTPAGLGFAESAIVGIFLLAADAGVAPGVDEHTAASIALLDRTISYWSVVVFGFLVYLLSKRSK